MYFGKNNSRKENYIGIETEHIILETTEADMISTGDDKKAF